jgi:hypothetical protein
MTDVPAILANNPNDFTRRWAEYEKRAAEFHPGNKTRLFAALRQNGISMITVTFDGEGDSGQIERIAAMSGEIDVALPDLMVEIVLLHFAIDEPERRSQPLKEAIETLTYFYLELTHCGWEINAGSHGEFVFDATAETISLDFNERFETSENFTHEF